MIRCLLAAVIAGRSGTPDPAPQEVFIPVGVSTHGVEAASSTNTEALGKGFPNRKAFQPCAIASASILLNHGFVSCLFVALLATLYMGNNMTLSKSKTRRLPVEPAWPGVRLPSMAVMQMKDGTISSGPRYAAILEWVRKAIQEELGLVRARKKELADFQSFWHGELFHDVWDSIDRYEAESLMSEGKAGQSSALRVLVRLWNDCKLDWVRRCEHCGRCFRGRRGTQAFCESNCRNASTYATDEYRERKQKYMRKWRRLTKERAMREVARARRQKPT